MSKANAKIKGFPYDFLQLVRYILVNISLNYQGCFLYF